MVDVFGLFLLSALLLGILSPGNVNTIVWLFLISAILIGSYVFLIIPMLLARRVRKHERLRCETTWSVDDTNTVITTKFGEIRRDWGAYQSVYETEEYYLLIFTVNSRLYQIVPKRAFETEEDEDAFRALLEQHGLRDN